MSATATGPKARPTLPPIWKMDCAIPFAPPDARRATFDDSGCSTDEPTPTKATDNNTAGKLLATESNSKPVSVKHMPTTNP